MTEVDIQCILLDSISVDCLLKMLQAASVNVYSPQPLAIGTDPASEGTHRKVDLSNLEP